MAGILDSKTRFIDMIVTQEGKRQIASGMLRAEYASISDAETFYDALEVDDVSNRIFFQAMDSPNNVIVLEKDDSGKMIEFNFSPTGSIVGNDIFEKDTTVTSSLRLQAVTGSAFASSAKSIMNSFASHFDSLQTLSTFEKSGNDFELSTERINFAISNSVPFPLGPHSETINVNDAEPFFLDSKLTHLPNFDFLPPVNTDGSNYGQYEDIRSLKRETLNDIKAIEIKSKWRLKTHDEMCIILSFEEGVHEKEFLKTISDLRINSIKIIFQSNRARAAGVRRQWKLIEVRV